MVVVGWSSSDLDLGLLGLGRLLGRLGLALLRGRGCFGHGFALNEGKEDVVEGQFLQVVRAATRMISAGHARLGKVQVYIGVKGTEDLQLSLQLLVCPGLRCSSPGFTRLRRLPPPP